jgi:hypothetical protein
MTSPTTSPTEHWKITISPCKTEGDGKLHVTTDGCKANAHEDHLKVIITALSRPELDHGIKIYESMREGLLHYPHPPALRVVESDEKTILITE